MKTEIINQTENPLFSRKEVTLNVTNNLTPSKVEAVKLIAEKVGGDESLVRIRKISSKFGSNVFTIVADVYKNKEEYARIVKKTKKEIEAENKA